MDLIICALDFIQCSVEKWCLPETETWLWESSWAIVSVFVATDFEDTEREKQRWEKRFLWNVFLYRDVSCALCSPFRKMQSTLCLSLSVFLTLYQLFPYLTNTGVLKIAMFLKFHQSRLVEEEKDHFLWLLLTAALVVRHQKIYAERICKENKN